MPANIPSPVVGAGGAGSKPWYEQMLLTLASQGPGMLMQFLEHRQAGQQAQANDAAAQAALQSFAGTANPMEQGAISAAGGSPGIAAAGGAVSPSGIKAPVVKPMTAGNQPNMQGMSRGVAGPLLQQLQQQRTLTSQQNEADTSAKMAIAGNKREEALQPGRIAGQQEGILTSQAQRAQSAAELRLSEQRAANEARMLPIQIEQLRASIGASNANIRASDAQVNTLASSLTTQHRDQFTKTFTSLLGTIGMGTGVNSKKDAERLAAKLVYGTDVMPKGAELDDYYKQLVATGQTPDLYTVVKDRMQKELHVTPDQYQMILGSLAAAGGNPKIALETANKNGATAQEMMRAAMIYGFETDSSVQLPIEIQSALPQLLKDLLPTNPNPINPILSKSGSERVY